MVATAGTKTSRTPALAKYEVLEELGHGGMATVYRAHDKRLGRDVAVKVLHPHLRDSREIAHRFGAEAKAVAKLRHPNIVEVFDVSSEEDTEQFLVVEFVRGKTLRKMLQEKGALPPEIAAAIALELLGALAHAHASGVVHRDVKPENVLVEHRPLGTDSKPSTVALESTRSVPTPVPSTRDANSPSSRQTPVEGHRGERIFVKLTDFGIAKLLDAQGVTSTGQVLGSPAHMAPEQIEGGEVDGRADVFGMGVLLYECMVGHLPFEGSNPAQVLRRVLDGIYPDAEREKPTIGKVWSSLLDRALARKPSLRFENAEVMRDAISAELARLGHRTPRVDLESYFDDPETWSSQHATQLIEGLCASGADARKRGDAVAAAADYNRALAYAPNDPHLLRIVSSMHRAEARRRVAKRVGPLVLGTLLLGTGAFAVARALRPDPPIALRAVDAGATSRAVSIPSTRVAAIPSGTPTPLPSSRIVQPANVTVGPAPSAPASKGTKRTVTLASLRPPFGVHMTVDGAEATDPSPGQKLSLDDKAHTLTFSCEKAMCEPRTISVAAGDADESIHVDLRILPAKLVVDGDPSHSYGIEEMPYVLIGAGAATEIMMTRGWQNVTVFDRADPSRRQAVKLEAGQQKSVSLKAP